jgi:hypothetical protein
MNRDAGVSCAGDRRTTPRLEKPGDWNHLEVRCEGSRTRIFLNGETTVDFTEPEASIPSHGRIALQIHGKCKAEISFRRSASTAAIEKSAEPHFARPDRFK